jgi:hypothetical protein
MWRFLEAGDSGKLNAGKLLDTTYFVWLHMYIDRIFNRSTDGVNAAGLVVAYTLPS